MTKFVKHFKSISLLKVFNLIKSLMISSVGTNRQSAIGYII